MLPSIHLQLPEPSNLSLETDAVGEVPADSLQFAASFAERLEIPAETESLQDLALAGQALPPTGNELPQSPGDVTIEAPQRWSGFSVERFANEIPLEGQPLPAIATELALEATHTQAAQVQASPPASVAFADNVHPANPDRLPRAIATAAIQAQRDLSMAEPETPQLTRESARRILQATPVASVPQGLANEDVGNSLGEAEMPRRSLAEYSTQIMQTTDVSGSRSAGVQAIANTVAVADSAALQLQVPERLTTNATPPVFTSSIDIPVKDTAWGDAVNQQVLVMAGKKIQTAEIRLTPAELGPLRVQLSFEDGVAEVTFAAQHALTREALESALPRLRDLFLDNGISLGHASVGEDSVEHERHGSESMVAESSADGDTSGKDHADESNVKTSPRTIHDGLIDTFV